MAVALKEDYQQALDEQKQEVQELAMAGLEQVKEGKTKDFNTVKEKLIARGVPYDEVMERFVDDEDFYFDYLYQFTHDQYIHVLEQALEKGQPQEAFKAAHTLKGLMANLGLVSLIEEFSPLLETLRAGSLEGTDALFASFQEAHREFCEFIKENVPR